MGTPYGTRQMMAYAGTTFGVKNHLGIPNKDKDRLWKAVLIMRNPFEAAIAQLNLEESQGNHSLRISDLRERSKVRGCDTDFLMSNAQVDAKVCQ